MGHGRGRGARLTAAIATGSIGAALALGGGSAAAAPGDTYYLSESKNTVVSFIVPANGNEVEQLGYAARKLKCSNGKVSKGGMVSSRPSVPVQETLAGQPYFEAFWAERAPGFGGISGDLGEDSVKGVVDVQIRKRKKVRCESGTRKWTATPVSETAWAEARDRAKIPDAFVP